jgi:hypothetical protein
LQTGVADDDARVCPRCGEAAGDNEYCQTCGLHLFAQPELPTREAWKAGSEARHGSDRSGAGKGERLLVDFPHARNAAALAALVLLLSMFMPLWGVLINREVTDNFDVVETTEGANAWERFQWEDWVMTGAILLAFAVFVVSLSQGPGKRTPNVAPVPLGFVIAFGAVSALLVGFHWVALASLITDGSTDEDSAEVFRALVAPTIAFVAAVVLTFAAAVMWRLATSRTGQARGHSPA